MAVKDKLVSLEVLKATTYDEVTNLKSTNQFVLIDTVNSSTDEYDVSIANGATIAFSVTNNAAYSGWYTVAALDSNGGTIVYSAKQADSGETVTGTLLLTKDCTKIKITNTNTRTARVVVRYQDNTLNKMFVNEQSIKGLEHIDYPAPNYAHATAQNGAFVTTDLTDGVPTISTSNNRCVVGPFHFTEDVEISCKTGYKYIIYYYFTNGSQAKMVQYNSTWTTEKHIVGVHPKYIYDTVYYIQISTTGDDPISDPYVLKNAIIIETAEGRNPMHLIECEGWNENFVPTATGNSNVTAGVFGSSEAADNTVYFGAANSDLLCSVAQGGNAVASNKSGTVTLERGKFDFRLLRKSAGRIMPNYHTFEDLYSYLNIKNVPYDYKKIEGCSATSDSLVYYPGAVNRGQTYYGNIASATVLTSENFKFSHVPAIAIYDGYAYVTFQASPDDNELVIGTSVYLAKVDLTENSVEYTKLAGTGTLGGLTFDGRCTNPVMYLDSTNGVITVLYSARINSVMYECSCVYTISSGSFTNSKCTIKSGTSTYDYSIDNFNQYIGVPSGSKAISGEIVMSVPQLDDGIYYSAISSGTAKDSITCILKSTDMIKWELYTALPALCGSDCECVIIVDDGYIYGASRHLLTDYTLCIWKLDMSTDKIVDHVQIPDCASRPTWYRHTNNNLYLIHSMSFRMRLQWLLVDKRQLAQSNDYCEIAHPYTVFGYNAITNDGTNVYMAVQSYYSNSSPRIGVAKLTWS